MSGPGDKMEYIQYRMLEKLLKIHPNATPIRATWADSFTKMIFKDGQQWAVWYNEKIEGSENKTTGILTEDQIHGYK